MFYEVQLEKKNLWWWDEDAYGKCNFCAPDDEHARLFVSSIVQRMNRKYRRMGEPRNVTVNYIRCLTETENGIVKKDVDLHTIGTPYKGFRQVRKALETFFPKSKNGKRFFSLMNGFHYFAPVARN